MSHAHFGGTKASEYEQARYAIQDEFGDLLGVDRSSGGYPWRPSSPLGVQIWETYEEAEKYRQVFARGDYDRHPSQDGRLWKIVAVRSSLEVMNDDA